MASYNQISKGNWQVVISLGNDPVTKKRIRVKKQGFKTKKEAEKFVNEYSSKVDNGFLLPKLCGEINVIYINQYRKTY